MNSPNRYPEDEMDNLVRGAVRARVSGQEPPDRVWERIKLELEAEESPAPERQSRIAWSPLVAQVALTLMLVLLGGIGLGTLLGPDDALNPTRDMTPSQTVAYVANNSSALSAASLRDQAELRLLKTRWNPHPVSQPQTAEENPPIWIPRDAPPNVFSPEGRALKSELTVWHLSAEEQNRLHGGPYPWYR
jgi:hypothetical protein